MSCPRCYTCVMFLLATLMAACPEPDPEDPGVHIHADEISTGRGVVSAEFTDLGESGGVCSETTDELRPGDSDWLPSCYDEASAVLRVTPAADSTFVGWGGACAAVGDGPVCVLDSINKEGVDVTIRFNKEPRCGDGVVDENEECDDGNDNELDWCRHCMVSSHHVLAMDQGRVMFMTRSPRTDPAPQDFDLLASIPAAVALTDAKPAILCADSDNFVGRHAWVASYVDRYRPTAVVGVNAGTQTVPRATRSLHIDGANEVETAAAIAQAVWKVARNVIVVRVGDYEAALIGAALAGRLRIPLLYEDPESPGSLGRSFDRLHTTSALFVGDGYPLAVETTVLSDAEAAITWMEANGLPVTYIAATDPRDRNGRTDGPKQSLLAPVLAAIRDGAVVPLRDTTSWGTVRDRLREAYKSFEGRSHPEYLALVGSTTSIPFAQVDNPLNWPETPMLMTDAPYANTDADPFLEIAIGRVVANDIHDGSVLVSRIATYEQLFDGVWERTFVETGWWGIAEIRPILTNVGLTGIDLTAGDVSHRDPIEAGVILHQDHSWQLGLGHAFNMSTTTLLAPSVILSKGCSTAGMDKSPPDSIVKHLFRQGAVAFMGGPRNLITMSTQMAVSTFNSVIEGKPLGHAYRDAFASVTLNVLDAPHDSAAEHGRYNWVYVGDPAFRMHTPPSRQASPSRTVVATNGRSLEAIPPEVWWVLQLPQSLMDEWNWPGDLYIPVGAGADPYTKWRAPGYDWETHYMIMKYDTTQRVANVTMRTSVPSPLGWGGSFHNNVHLDVHQDGSRSYLWRSRVLDFDHETGTIFNQADRIIYDIELE